MYQYQTPILIKEKYDFSKVKPEGQKELSEMMGYDFTLVDVVQYLKKISKNFTEQDTLSVEIDKTISKIVESHHTDTQTPNPLKKSEPEDSKADNAKQISDIEDLIATLKDLEGNEEAENLIEILQDTLVSLKNQ